jgi:nitronate monooxygenase
MEHPRIIQGGMGAGVSDWRLARAVSREGAMGVVSGTALDIILARRLQQGDPGGHMRRGLEAFPDQAVAQRILDRYYLPQGTPDFHRYTLTPVATLRPESSAVGAHGTNEIAKDAPSDHQRSHGVLSGDLLELLVVANFVEIYLAKEDHHGPIGVNYLEKIQMPNLASIYGAMLAGVDYILMGAGIPLEIPGVLDRYARGGAAEITLAVEDAPRSEVYALRFDPASILESPPAELKRPAFLAIVSSNVLAKTMVARATGVVDGIIVEDHTAGGHNAPPRGELHLTEDGEPIFGSKDEVDATRMQELKVPFWLGGSRSDPDSLEKSVAAGALGVQVGTLFAFCRESGFLPELKKRFLQLVEAGKMRVFTHPGASPTGYPIKMALLEGTVAEDNEFSRRKRVCNLGLLRHIYRKEQGELGGSSLESSAQDASPSYPDITSLGYRCPAEPVEAFVRKGGAEEAAIHARCLCNGLLASIGLAMEYAGGYLEKPLLVPGEYLESLRVLIRKVGHDYSAADVIRFLTGTPPQSV